MCLLSFDDLLGSRPSEVSTGCLSPDDERLDLSGLELFSYPASLLLSMPTTQHRRIFGDPGNLLEPACASEVGRLLSRKVLGSGYNHLPEELAVWIGVPMNGLGRLTSAWVNGLLDPLPRLNIQPRVGASMSRSSRPLARPPVVVMLEGYARSYATADHSRTHCPIFSGSGPADYSGAVQPLHLKQKPYRHGPLEGQVEGSVAHQDGPAQPTTSSSLTSGKIGTPFTVFCDRRDMSTFHGSNQSSGSMRHVQVSSMRPSADVNDPDRADACPICIGRFNIDGLEGYPWGLAREELLSLEPLRLLVVDEMAVLAASLQADVS